ncbi:glycosyltransferase family 2 protein [Gordonibacter urolithinfaciens]|uniref:glycosyltransferase family 2 protein n=1 Tax=Gordonibacter urolithinfaciens TaxID=1335613 RepID=UPI001D0643D7|nr:glycosyltransferase family 2 protein [Gordonibacter urolithinfaciens]MCB6561724.1 glycosyltransferase [Gordonibacter urolithinfaciens]MCB7085715.1 glycosyltransferase [Gordonibacter urolithinfaciens]
MNTLRASVIIPVHNAQDHLAQCIESVMCQTMSDIEIICIDDGSSDLSLRILQEYQCEDQRIIVIEQDNRGGGAARNVGLSQAQGTYLAFLDADDYYEPSMLEKCTTLLDSTGADIAVCRSLTYDMQTGLSHEADWTYKVDRIPQKQPFSYVDMPDDIFNTFANVPWNKVFRRSFVEENNLKFQEIRRTNDLFFVCSALVMAKGIVTIDEHLVHYRIGATSNCQATNDREPLGFYFAFSKLKDYLIEQGLFEKVERSFKNHALDGLVANLSSLKSFEGFNVLYNAFYFEIEKKFGILDQAEDYYENRRQYEIYSSLSIMSKEEFLFARMCQFREERDRAWKDCDLLHQDIYKGWHEIEAFKKLMDDACGERDAAIKECVEAKESISYKLGRKLTAPYRRLRNVFEGTKA